jgi:glycosyltransferase involved in cell wall biosynthesis
MVAHRRRILHVGPDPSGVGGMESVIRNYVRISQSDVSADGFEFDAVAVPSWRRDRSIAGNLAGMLRAVLVIAREMSRSRGTIVHVHLSDRGSFVREGFIVLASRVLRAPTFATVHGSDFVESTLRSHWDWVYRLPLRWCSAVIVLNASAMELAGRLAGERKVRILPNPGPVPVALPYQAPQCPAAVLFVGLRSTRKGLDVLLAAWPEVIRRVPNAELWIAGPGEDVELPPDDSMVDLGVLTSDAVLETLSRAAVATLPSRQEGMPVFIIETLAAGRPSVVTTAGAMAEMVSDAGLAISPADVKGLADRLVELLENPALQEQLGRRAASTYARRHSWEAQRQSLAALYLGQEGP